MNQRAPGPGQGFFYWNDGPNSLEWVIFALLLVVILLLVALLALALTRRMRFRGRHVEHRLHGPPGGGPPFGRPDPLSIARMRYARGEIGRDEFVQLTQDLGGEPEAEPLTPPA